MDAIIMKISRKGPRRYKHKSPLPATKPLALPNERDESVDPVPATPRKIMRQAYQDLRRGLVDTDLHGERGVEAVVHPQDPKKDGGTG
ncbi:MAG TPA: hypothetical protein DIT28_14005 [Oxalobacteraceae bacterium]|nr:hypothetical protein [Oxalobacteraceae bacterium]HCN90270.1 hypothetical protein [Oxalobacteraceae bacterium]